MRFNVAKEYGNLIRLMTPDEIYQHACEQVASLSPVDLDRLVRDLLAIMKTLAEYDGHERRLGQALVDIGKPIPTTPLNYAMWLMSALLVMLKDDSAVQPVSYAMSRTPVNELTVRMMGIMQAMVVKHHLMQSGRPIEEALLDMQQYRNTGEPVVGVLSHDGKVSKHSIGKEPKK